uniref:Uncharacterized protein n=1 Tax=Sipha flava TaxID=143950 RepID=A0A2S2R2W3_9HEMI
MTLENPTRALYCRGALTERRVLRTYCVRARIVISVGGKKKYYTRDCGRCAELRTKMGTAGVLIITIMDRSCARHTNECVYTRLLPPWQKDERVEEAARGWQCTPEDDW